MAGRLVAFAATTAAVATFSAGLPASVASAQDHTYEPPTDGPVVDGFRLPDGPYGAGNRGLEYSTQPGDGVSAAGDGSVTFAGPVGGSLHVVVQHADGLRTTYAFLRSIDVNAGDNVVQGQRVGTAGDSFHFTARVGSTYLDPSLLFGGPLKIWLVPSDEEQSRRDAARNRVLDQLTERLDGPGPLNLLRRGGEFVVHFGGDVLALGYAWARAEILEFAHLVTMLYQYLREWNSAAVAMRLINVTLSWWAQRGECTSRDAEPPRLAERRIVVLVDGVDSGTDSSTLEDLDFDALGYAPDDVIRFSYGGGRTPDSTDSIADIPATEYDRYDADDDLRVSGQRLRELLSAIEQAAPGVPIDFIGHGQGGLVARLALGAEEASSVRSLVTIGTPHQGSDAATGFVLIDHSSLGAIAHRLAFAFGALPTDPDAPAPGQQIEGSDLLHDLDDQTLPEDTNVTSIGGRLDIVVTGPNTRLPGANNVIVDWGTHGSLPGTSEVLREVALAVHGMAPTCQTLWNMLTDHAEGELISLGTDALSLSTFVGLELLGEIIPGPRIINKTE